MRRPRRGFRSSTYLIYKPALWLWSTWSLYQSCCTVHTMFYQTIAPTSPKPSSPLPSPPYLLTSNRWHHYRKREYHGHRNTAVITSTKPPSSTSTTTTSTTTPTTSSNTTTLTPQRCLLQLNMHSLTSSSSSSSSSFGLSFLCCYLSRIRRSYSNKFNGVDFRKICHK